MLQNERVVAKIGFGTAENELSKAWVTNHPTLLNRINVCEYRLLVRVLRGGVVLNILRGILVGEDLSRGYRREQLSGALALVERFDIEPFSDFSAK